MYAQSPVDGCFRLHRDVKPWRVSRQQLSENQRPHHAAQALWPRTVRRGYALRFVPRVQHRKREITHVTHGNMVGFCAVHAHTDVVIAAWRRRDTHPQVT